MKRAALAAAAVVLLLELALRAIGYAAPQWYQLDRELGWQLHPHRHGWTIAGGGSCRELQRCGFQPDKLLEVLNFGVDGYGTAQEYVLLETKAIRYQPDLVLLQFSPGDVMDSTATASRASTIPSPPRPRSTAACRPAIGWPRRSPITRGAGSSRGRWRSSPSSARPTPAATSPFST